MGGRLMVVWFTDNLKIGKKGDFSDFGCDDLT